VSGSELGFRVRDGVSPHRQELAVGGGGSTKRGGKPWKGGGGGNSESVGWSTAAALPLTHWARVGGNSAQSC
jgi:hypothetical protein